MNRRNSKLHYFQTVSAHTTDFDDSFMVIYIYFTCEKQYTFLQLQFSNTVSAMASQMENITLYFLVLSCHILFIDITVKITEK